MKLLQPLTAGLALLISGCSFHWSPPASIAVGAELKKQPAAELSQKPPIETEEQQEEAIKETEPAEDDLEVDPATREEAPPELEKHPFPHRVEIPDFPRGMEWINSQPLKKADLRGKFVILDFWTYCCINCIHVLPELKKLEQAYPNNLVVIGVHSAKFETEKEAKNIEEAVLRYEIEHPVINDSEHRIWNMYGVRSWPTLLMIDPEGNAVWGRPGEITFEDVDPVLKRAIPFYREKGLLDEKPLKFDLAKHKQEATPLRFPGKILADEAGQRLFIADSNHNRIVIADLDGKLIETIGSGNIGLADGDYSTAEFNKPQGMALHEKWLYVADTENHLLRKIDLERKEVVTIAGLGSQSRNAWPGAADLGAFDELPDRFVGLPKLTGLNSPWAVWVHKEDLYIAMAGPHQIWKMTLDEKEIGPYAGNGREDIVDGPLLPERPYELGYSSFAQPSGLASDGEWLYVADSEGSSIRAVPFDPKKAVKTVVGTSRLPYARLFTFGFVDGEAEKAMLQHALGVVHREGKLYVADTYNNAIRMVDAATGEVTTLAGKKVENKETGESEGVAGFSDEEGTFDEPAGITLAGNTLYVADTNNHAIRTVDLKAGKVQTLQIAGLAPPQPKSAPKPKFPGAAQVQVPAAKVKPAEGKVELAVNLKLPAGWKINPLAPMKYYLEAEAEAGPIDRTALNQSIKLKEPAAAFTISLPAAASGADTVKVSMNYYYCQKEDDGVCKIGAVVFTVPLTLADDGAAGAVKLDFEVPN